MAGKLDIEIVTGERVVFKEEGADMVVAPGGAGMLGILPQHAPLITTLSLGELRIKKGNEEQSILVYGGFMEVRDDKVLVLADSAERAEEVDVERAETARRRAEQSIAGRESTMDLEEAQATLRRANLRLRVGQRRGSRRGGPSGAGTIPGAPS
jgi:F-type H+-transporting ATPase subunit epsilon